MIAATKKNTIIVDKLSFLKESGFVFNKLKTSFMHKNIKSNKEIMRHNNPLLEPIKNMRYIDRITIRKERIRRIPLNAKNIPKNKGTTIATYAPKERASLKVAFINSWIILPGLFPNFRSMKC